MKWKKMCAKDLFEAYSIVLAFQKLLFIPLTFFSKSIVCWKYRTFFINAKKVHLSWNNLSIDINGVPSASSLSLFYLYSESIAMLYNIALFFCSSLFSYVYYLTSKVHADPITRSARCVCSFALAPSFLFYFIIRPKKNTLALVCLRYKCLRD